MGFQANRLPTRFPVGTRYVIEGRGGRIRAYLEFPDGRHVDLPTKAAARTPSRAASACRISRRSPAKKILRGDGTGSVLSD
jgi:hypothetical protein